METHHGDPGSNDALLADARRGDRDALTVLLTQHGPTVRGVVTAELGSQYRTVLDEDDVMQVTYLEAFLRISDLNAGDARGFVVWLTQIAKNNLRDAIRGLTRDKRPDPRRRMHAASPDESAVALIELAGCDSTTPSRIAGAAERRGILTDALAQLPADYARVLREYDLACKPVEEVAANMKRSTGAIFMLRARAIERLRDVLPSVTAMYGTRNQ